MMKIETNKELPEDIREELVAIRKEIKNLSSDSVDMDLTNENYLVTLFKEGLDELEE